MPPRKINYNESFIKFGFTSIIQDGIEKPQCVICEKVLAVESMKPNQLQKHFTRLHEDIFNEDIAEFQRLAGEIMKRKSNESEASENKIWEPSYSGKQLQVFTNIVIVI